MVARVVPQSARRRHAESRKPDLRGVVARPKAPVLCVKEYFVLHLRDRRRRGGPEGPPSNDHQDKLQMR